MKEPGWLRDNHLVATTREHLDKHEKQLDKHDRQIAAILTLVKQGMRLLVETRKDIRSLAAAQKRTDEELREFIASLRRGGNGHRKQKLDLP